MKYFPQIFIFFLFCISRHLGYTQSRELVGERTNEAIKVDGELSEAIWQTSPIATDFIDNNIHPGNISTQRTEVRVVYDNTAIYIGAKLWDTSPDSILKELGTRDAGENNADLFGVFFDTYWDKQNYFSFIVSASGVQTDLRGSPDNEDVDWNAVWYSKAKTTSDGWIVEMKIPYSALRFPKKDIQTWGLNFMRVVRRNREKSFWNDIKPSVQGVANQFGSLKNLTDISPPFRLILYPYASSYWVHDGYSQTSNRLFRGGADLKYGINESFTLDMTLVPDFGQVQSDNVVYNLTPFEVRFNEYRQFFTEGTELFNKNNLFYSRRVGGTPMYHGNVQGQLNPGETILQNPTSSQLLNATKISGRTQNKTGFGFFNAITSTTEAIVSDSVGNERSIITSPLTNYNMWVVEQPFMKNSSIALVNTNVLRNGGDNPDANVTAAIFKVADNENKYATSGNFCLSQIHQAGTSPYLGYYYEAYAGKYSGKLNYELSRQVASLQYQQNDLGYLPNNNQITNKAFAAWRQFEPQGKIQRRTHSGFVQVQQYFSNKKYMSLELHTDQFLMTRKFFATGCNISLYPMYIHDYFATRVPNRYIKIPSGGWINYWISSDYRKKVALDLAGGAFTSFSQGIRQYWINLDPRFRLNNHLFILYSFAAELPRNDVGWAATDANGAPIFGRRNVNNISQTLTGTYTFTPRMSLSLRLRHYSLSTQYKEYYRINDNGEWTKDAQYSDSHNLSFNAFNLDCVYKWEFTPGSFLSIVWKNAISDFQPLYIPSYINNIRHTFDVPQVNSLSARVVYFMDAQMFRKKKLVKVG